MRKLIGLLAILLLTFTVVAMAADGPVLKDGKKGRESISQEVWHKLTGPLKDAVKEYRKEARLKRPANAELKSIKVRVAKPIVEGEKATFEYKNQKMKPSLLESLIDPVVQKRWKNPSYDVLRCLVQTTGDPKELEKYNVKVRAVSNLGSYKVVSVEMASTEIEKVAKLASVKRLSASMNRELDNSRATFNTGASKIRLKRGGLFQNGYTGKGVLVAAIDSGIDFTHGDFLNEDGSSRVMYIWDVTEDIAGKSPADVFGAPLDGLDYGTVWTKAEIDAGLCTQVDNVGHGTHVMGSAAGNGSATGYYAGQAPNADILAVKGLDNNGILFCLEVAKRMEQPVAVNMSYGYGTPYAYAAYYPDSFPADGTSPDALMMKGWMDEYGSGNVIVGSAGNAGHWNNVLDMDVIPPTVGGYHSGASLAAASTHTLKVPDYGTFWLDTWDYAPYEYDYPYVCVGMWYESPVQVTFISPNGDTIGPMVHGDYGVLWDASYLNAVYYWMNYDAGENGHYPAFFDLGDYFYDACYPTMGDWQVLVEPIGGSGTGRVDMHCTARNLFLGFLDMWLLEAAPTFQGDITNVHSNYVLDEDSSPYTITVGSWVSRVWWPSIDGWWYSWPWGDQMGHIATYSNPGPSRDRRMKPDIAAPGSSVVSVLSNDYTDDDELISFTGQHVVMRGTSMAAPQVTGGCALILEKYPTKSYARVRDLISSYARTDQLTRLYGMQAFGAGKFNVKPLNEPPVPMVTASNVGGIPTFDASASYDPEDFPMNYEFRVEAESFSATELTYTPDLTGVGVMSITPDATLSGRYRVKVRVNDTIVNSDWIISDWITITH
ncbi:MAG: S8 family serine peptidase [bacterium]|nr:S8 family serine peptidase [bacterium]